MGQPVSKESRGDKARSDAIDRQITEDSKRYKKECKILLLGSGESGKSTIVKQMKIIHQAGFDARERQEYRTTIYKNVLDSAGTLARVVRRVGLGAFSDEGGERSEREYARAVLRAFPPVPGAGEEVGLGGEWGGDGSSSVEMESDGTEAGSYGYTSTIATSEIEVGVDPVPFTRADYERARYAERERDRERGGYIEQRAYGSFSGVPVANTSYGGGGKTGRVSARPATAEMPTPVSDVLAQTHATLTPALADAIWHVARAPAVERLVDEHPADFYLMDSAGYFFSSIHRIAAPTYVPSEEDVLRARARSTAIIETRFWMGDLMIHMFDVGGQRSERKKWIHCFESPVTSLSAASLALLPPGAASTTITLPVLLARGSIV
ncbi:guanine nucleotide binding protein, alpha subunit [Mycena sanguinolenta]|nr:guanine nucleotide binding protein, alpha subunit [Mycena sanguinolenta]